jgi:hypothetical protein
MQLRLLMAAGAALLFSACINNEQTGAELAKAAKDSANFTTIQWAEQVKDMGKVKEGQKLDVEYHFKNTGSKPLVITDVRPGCGCTVADKPAEPIMPGKEGTIKASFDSEGKQGQQHKTIAVMANTKPSQNFSLEFNVEVEKKS